MRQPTVAVYANVSLQALSTCLPACCNAVARTHGSFAHIGALPAFLRTTSYNVIRGTRTLTQISSSVNRPAAAVSHSGFVVVPEQVAYVVERLGRFRQVLPPGFHLLVPFLDRVAYIHSLKEETIEIPGQSAITKDNVTLQLDGVLYIRIENPYDASYGVRDPLFAVTQLAQTTMRSELGKLTLDETFLERDSLNAAINRAINTAAANWGVKCMRYEIRDIIVPANIRSAMEKQAEAERRKRAEILQSEAERESEINISQGRKQALILQAQGEAEAVRQRAIATAEGIQLVAKATQCEGGTHAMSLQIAEQYMEAFAKLAKEGTSIIIPSALNDPAGIIVQSLAVFQKIAQQGEKSSQPAIDPR